MPTLYKGTLKRDGKIIFATEEPANFISTRSQMERALPPGTRLKRQLECDSFIEYIMLDRDDKVVGSASAEEVGA